MTSVRRLPPSRAPRISCASRCPPEMSKPRELAETISEESNRLVRIVRNVLDLSRLEIGGLRLNIEWQSLEELVGSAVERTRACSAGGASKSSCPRICPW